MNNKQKYRPNSKQYIVMACFLLIICFLGIGYAQITGINLSIGGNAIAMHQEGIFITNVTYNSSTSYGNEANSTLTAIYGTLSEADIKLGNNNASNVTFTVNVLNSDSSEDYIFISADKANSFYDNNEIKYELSNINNTTVVSHGTSKTFNVTFKYESNATLTDRDLNGYVNFRFRKVYHITYGTGIVTTGYSHPTVAPHWETGDTDNKTLTINFGSDKPDSVAITAVGTTYTENTDYTYSNGVLTFTNGLKSDVTISGYSGTSGSGTPSDPYINHSQTYDSDDVEPGVTVFDTAPGAPQVVATTDSGGNTVITSFEYTNASSTNPVSFTNGSSVDTGVLALDGGAFTVHIKFKTDLSLAANNGNFIFSAIEYNSSSNVYSGFSLFDYNYGYLRIGIYRNRQRNTNTGLLTPNNYSTYNSTALTGEKVFDVTITYDPKGNNNQYGQIYWTVSVDGGVASGKVAAKNTKPPGSSSNIVPETLTNAEVTIGGNGISANDDIGSMQVYEFSVSKN